MKNFLLAVNSAMLVGFASLYLWQQSGCAGHPLTVEEADAALTASCVLLSRAMTAQHPERFPTPLASEGAGYPRLDAVVAQVCQPGRTREIIERILANPSRSSSEFLDLDLDAPYTPPPTDLLSDAGVMSTRAP